MDDLVEWTIQAHGGLEAWKHVREIAMDFSAWGTGLKQRGPLGEALSKTPMRATVTAREQEVRFVPFIDPVRKGLYTPDQTLIEATDGTIAEALFDPRGSLKNMPAGTPWTATQILYFFGYSLWMYINLPYAFLRGGVVCEEVEPMQVGAETWRALRVVYAGDFPAHAPEQIHYFDAQGYMRRQDYSVDVRQDLKVAHYMHGHRRFDGFVFPTERRIYPCGMDGMPDTDVILIAADFDNYALLRDGR